MKIEKEETVRLTEEFLNDPINVHEYERGIGLCLCLVSEFNAVGGTEIYSEPVSVDDESAKLTISLLKEELDELDYAYATKNIAEQLDAQIDLFYVLLGAVLKSGLGNHFIRGFIEVHKNNMEKFPNGVCTKNENGKIVKPAGFKNIDLGEIYPELKTV